MNTNSELDHIVSTWLAGRAVDAPPDSLRVALARAEQTPQQRHRWLPSWSSRDRDGAATAPSARDTDTSPNRRNRAMPVFSAVATGVAVISIVGTFAILQGTADPMPQPPAAAATHSVAAVGGDFATITEAVAAVQEGDTILVEPGTYEEAFAIEADITIAGAGAEPRDTVIIIPPGAPSPAAPIGPLHAEVPAFDASPLPSVGIQLLDTAAVLQNLEIMGHDDGVAVLVRGGTPSFEDVVIRHGGERDVNAVLAGGLVVDDAAVLSVLRGQLWSRLQVDEASTLVLDDALLQWPRLVVQGGSQVEIRGGTVFGSDGPPIVVIDDGSLRAEGTEFVQGGVHVVGTEDATAFATITDSSFASAPLHAVHVDGGAGALLERDTFTDSHIAVAVGGADVVVRDSVFLSNQTALELDRAGGEYVRNDIDAGDIGIHVKEGGEPIVRDNTVDDANLRGIIIGAGSRPSVDGNRLCGNRIDIHIEPDAEPVLGDNETC